MVMFLLSHGCLVISGFAGLKEVKAELNHSKNERTYGSDGFNGSPEGRTLVKSLRMAALCNQHLSLKEG